MGFDKLPITFGLGVNITRITDLSRLISMKAVIKITNIPGVFPLKYILESEPHVTYAQHDSQSINVYTSLINIIIIIIVVAGVAVNLRS